MLKLAKIRAQGSLNSLLEEKFFLNNLSLALETTSFFIY